MKIKNFILVYSIIFTCFFLLFNLKSYAQGYRYNGEIMGEVIGLDGSVNWRVNAQCISSYRWEIVNGECYLTSDHGTAYIEGVGNSMSTFGFHNPGGHEGKNYDIAFGDYRFTFDLPGSNDDTSFILDLRDADWTGNYSSPYDITIRWDIENRELKYRIGGTGNPYYYLNDDTIWDILDESPPNQEAFQPTKPLQFSCTNLNQYGEHPYFTWEVPDWPSGGIRGDRNLTVYYRIYRNNIQVSPDLTSLTWTDNDATILPYGLRLNYHATAKLSNSPESENSNTVSLRGSLAKPEDQQPDRHNNSYDGNEDIFMNTYPNPFNPTTTISYFLLNDGFVRLSIFNISGQQIAELVSGRKLAGTHSVNFNATSLSGGIYFVRFQIENQQVTKKILLFK